MRHYGFCISLIACALIVAGCTQVGPDFERPDATTNTEWETFESARVDPEQPDITEWWHVFNDASLNELINIAFADNLSLETAGLRVLEARAQLGIAVGGLYPQQQSVDGAVIYTDRSANSAGPGTDLSSWQYSLGVGVGWELDFWGKFRRGVESADAALFASIAGYDAALVLLFSQVVDTYIVIRATEAQLAISRDNVDLQRKSYEITDALYRNGEQSELDRQQALTLLLGTEATIPGLLAALDQARNALSILLGRPPGDIETLIGTTAAIPESPREVAVGIPADLLRRRPDVRQAELQAAVQSARIGVASADLYPSFVLTGSLGLVSTSGTDAISGGSFLDADNLQFTGGPAFNWPFFNYGRLKNNVRVQDARFQQTLVNYENQVLGAAREVEDAITGYVRGLDQQEILRRGVEAAKRSADISMLRYKEGFSDYQRVLNAQQSLFGQQQRYITARSETVRSVTALYKALGGGWEVRGARNFVDEDTITTMQERTNWGQLLEVEAIENPDKTDTVLPNPDW
ncbi:MAG: efflux transporter outer membrane subunit [Gammaproteobacteria bacterium]